METLGVGIIGCGNISTAYLRLGPLFKGLEIRAVADISPSVAEARAAEFDVRAETVEGLLNCDDVVVIVNLTIPAAHYEVSSEILKAGKHAYSEKPLVLSLDQAQTLRGLAEDRNLRVGSAPDTFLGGAHQQARSLIDDGAIGLVVTGTAHVMSPGMEHWHPNPDFFFQLGGGPVLDIGPYYITNLIQLLGPVASVAAAASSATTTRTITSEPRRGEVIAVETPTTIHAILEFVSGAIITLGASWDVKAHTHANMELYGTDGSLFVPDPNFFGGKLTRSDAKGQVEEVSAWDHPFGRPNQGTDGPSPIANYRAAGLADMVAAIHEERPHRCSLEMAVHAVDVMTSILRAAEERRVLDLTTSCERPAALGPEDAKALMKA